MIVPPLNDNYIKYIKIIDIITLITKKMLRYNSHDGFY